jgi:hypothetical protein
MSGMLERLVTFVRTGLSGPRGFASSRPSEVPQGRQLQGLPLHRRCHQLVHTLKFSISLELLSPALPSPKSTLFGRVLRWMRRAALQHQLCHTTPWKAQALIISNPSYHHTRLINVSNPFIRLLCTDEGPWDPAQHDSWLETCTVDVCSQFLSPSKPTD